MAFAAPTCMLWKVNSTRTRYRFPIIPGHQVVGTVEAAPEDSRFETGQRVGVAWLNATCGSCHFCDSGRENLCDTPEFTGWTRNGGFAEYIAAPAEFVYALPSGLSDIEAAPLLCAGIIGYRCLRQCELQDLGRCEARLVRIWRSRPYRDPDCPASWCRGVCLHP